MSDSPLDEIDKGILHLLQEDARHKTPVDIARKLPVSDSTVRNRIERMEEAGVIDGYVPTINYEEAGFPLNVVFVCTAPISERADLARQAREVPHVIEIQELMTGTNNVEVSAIATELDDITRTAFALNDLGLEIRVEKLVRSRYLQPFNHFGEEFVED